MDCGASAGVTFCAVALIFDFQRFFAEAKVYSP